MRLIFNLFDQNNDGYICLEDLNNLSTEYAGNNFYIMKDILLLIHTLSEKIKKN